MQNGKLLQFSPASLSVFEKHRQLRNDQNEAGGLLIGRMLLQGDVIIDQAVEPSMEDKSSRFSFFRPIKLAQQFVVRIWHRSRGTQNYLGEWHTHPEDNPNPSSTDIKNWIKVWQTSSEEIGELFFVIVGRKAVGVWSVNSKSGRPVSLKEVSR